MHEYFQLELEFITKPATETEQQSSKIMRPATAVEDINAPGRKHAQGMLQRADLEKQKSCLRTGILFTGPWGKTESFLPVRNAGSVSSRAARHLRLLLLEQSITDGSHKLVD